MVYKCYKYSDDDYRIVCMHSHTTTNNIEKNKTGRTSQNECLRIATSRAFHKINEYIKCNPDFKYFFTCTVASSSCDRYSLIDTQSYMKRIIKKIRRRDDTFRYIFVTETHKDGAFHFHGVCTDLPLYTNKYGYFSSFDFDELGFNSFSIIKDLTACSYYISKYITKDSIREYGAHSYFCSRGLKTAEVTECEPFDMTKFDVPERHFKDKQHYIKDEYTSFFKNDYCQVLDYKPSCLNAKDLNYIIQSIYKPKY